MRLAEESAGNWSIVESAIAPKRPLCNCPGDPRRGALMLFARPRRRSIPDITRSRKVTPALQVIREIYRVAILCRRTGHEGARGICAPARIVLQCQNARHERSAGADRPGRARARIPSKANKVRRLGANNARRHAGHSISRPRFRGETQPPARGGAVTSGRLARSRPRIPNDLSR